MRRRRHEAIVGDGHGAPRARGVDGDRGTVLDLGRLIVGQFGDSQAAPSAGAETSSTAAAPMTSTSTWSWSHQGREGRLLQSA